ncbi:hypothetical protein MMC18_001930 [Xylographa bjoerkii]|nr:hypothetical protein [Xylographa bjoerkii]
MAMDGASGVMAVASLALQLVDSVKQLYDFWESVREAPSSITGLVEDLKIFSAMLEELQHDEEIFGPQKVTLLALESCRVKVNTLHALLQPAGFNSTSKVVRKWTSLKAVLRRDKLERFRCILQEAHNTLMSAQLINLRRLSQRQLQYHETKKHQTEYAYPVGAVREGLAGLRMEQSSELVKTTTSAPSTAEHREDITREIKKMAANIANPVIRAGCERGMIAALEQTFSNSPHENPPEQLPEVTATRHTSRDQGDRKLRVVLSRETSKLETVFGSFGFYRETAKFCMEANPRNKSVLSERYEYKTIFRFFPASWLINMGLDYSINLMFLSNYQGWRQCLNKMRAVPGDSPIFYACGKGDLEQVSYLISTGQASTRDQSLNGVTPLHIAAYFRQPAVCQYLLDHNSDQFALMQTWDNKLLSPAQMACTLSWDVFVAENLSLGTFGSKEETLAHFFGTDGGFEDPALKKIDMLGNSYQEILVEVLGDGNSLVRYPRLNWFSQQAAMDLGNGEVYSHSGGPSIKSIIANCANLSPNNSIKDSPYHVETITSLAMRDPFHFQLWRTHISTMSEGLRAILDRDFSVGRLKDDGWTPSTLCRMFLEWEEYVDSIKNGTFHGCKAQAHVIFPTNPPIHEGKPRGLGIPHHKEPIRLPTSEQNVEARRIRQTFIRNQNQRYQHELQFWNHRGSFYYRFRDYRTRELYDIYARTGLCPYCAADEAGRGPNHGAVTEPDDKAGEEDEEEPPMLAPF